jgi:hypothetical protein
MTDLEKIQFNDVLESTSGTGFVSFTENSVDELVDNIIRFFRKTYDLHIYHDPSNSELNGPIDTFEPNILWPDMPEVFVGEDDFTFSNYNDAMIHAIKDASKMLVVKLSSGNYKDLLK